MATFDCFKCLGSGKVPFTHIEGGVCFTCGGSGKLSYRKKEKAWVDPHPDWLVPEATRSTLKQWEYLEKLLESSDARRKAILAAGAPCASQRYVSKATMSKAIEIAKGGQQ